MTSLGNPSKLCTVFFFFCSLQQVLSDLIWTFNIWCQAGGIKCRLIEHHYVSYEALIATYLVLAACVCEGILDRCNSLDESREARQTHFERRRPRWPDNIDCLMILTHSASASASYRPRWPDNNESFRCFFLLKSWTMLVSVWCGYMQQATTRILEPRHKSGRMIFCREQKKMLGSG